MMVVRSYLSSSSIEGLGVFAAEPISKGTLVWRFDRRFDLMISKDEIASCPPHIRDYLDRYSYEFHEDSNFVILDADDGRYMNHSDLPNVDLTDPEIGIAARDIAAGEELTCDYACFMVGGVEFQPSRGIAEGCVIPEAVVIQKRAQKRQRVRPPLRQKRPRTGNHPAGD
jgi:SET domain-containing protein